MGPEEGAAGPGVVATRAAEHIRRHDPRSPPALDRGTPDDPAAEFRRHMR